MQNELLIKVRRRLYTFDNGMIVIGSLSPLNGLSIISTPALKGMREEAGFRTDCFKIGVHNTIEIILQP